jgi:hypothetical protein
MITVVCVTLIVTWAVPPCESPTIIVVLPGPFSVAVNCALGPDPDEGLTVTIPVFPLDAVNDPE